jgi:hypothetical protein
MQSKAIVEAILQDSSIDTSKAVFDRMRDIVTEKLEEKKLEVAKKFFVTEDAPLLEDALDHVIGRLNEGDIDALETYITEASNFYDVPERQIAEKLLSITEEMVYIPERQEFLTSLVEGIQNELNSIIVEFDNSSSRIVTMDEARSILSLWESLNHENRKIMENKITADSKSFEKVLAFANKVEN